MDNNSYSAHRSFGVGEEVAFMGDWMDGYTNTTYIAGNIHALNNVRMTFTCDI